MNLSSQHWNVWDLKRIIVHIIIIIIIIDVIILVWPFFTG